ncbi:2-polyprenyl-6-methoxyphenol hydroxylase-like FAD-dependent oxidoreductase [Streptomyces umbrinus]|uniref:2-polyprenyl-6-methoxyphenol hydroxylase-like FAD-dependent oxidoreductase n=1 Tax=Streptomyces umbrinus TaxID=67370 RepID=A0ABU0T4R8_9ACTN|nr:FAD-dependent oxidoreductase [Streptomyces umbrinus]MDQ1030657.1 2-polyprenyl-6-methoxyphenol hydroxylase-like FAD-dependent oxidoreductase [Streptomyces umbrinus]
MDVPTQVCVVGGGPAGLTLAVELARRSVPVVVVEASRHFNRSFRGESVSPDSVWLLDRLGLLDRLDGEYVQMHHMRIQDSGHTVLAADFERFRYPHPFPVELPQPALLSALAETGAAHPGFTLLQGATATGLLRDDDGTVTGVQVRTAEGEREIRATLTVAADGRFSKVREMSGLAHRTMPLERDVIWLKLPFPYGDWDDRTYRVRIRGDQHGLFIPTRPDSVRVGFNIPKGGLKEMRGQGLPRLYERLDALAPELSGAVREQVRSWSDTSMLDIFTTVVPRWSAPGIVLVGDAAHTLTPILGQGVNHAIIDAVTLAPLVADALDSGPQALNAATDTFQRTREASVARSRALQLRQERLFTLHGRVGGAWRRTLYRGVNRSELLTRRVLAGAYFQLQEPGERVAKVHDAGR